ncbi:MAG: hypothetical protein SFZ23_14445 [Planctomycetota bacterium]|nr:hypothetical protein [Planctomycetota bacterium]
MNISNSFLSRNLLVAIALSPSVALAQVGTATFTWQASTDGGQTWQSNLIEVDQVVRDLRVRGWFDWSPDAGVALFNTTFDCTISSMSNGDIATDPSRRAPFTSFHQQSLVATRFGNVIKVDDERDTAPPGVGTRGVTNNQLWRDAGLPYTEDRPLSLLSFTFRLSGDLGDRTIDSSFGLAPTTDYRPRLFTSRSSSASNQPLTTTVPLTIRVVPAPGAAAFMTLGMLAASRRRR